MSPRNCGKLASSATRPASPTSSPKMQESHHRGHRGTQRSSFQGGRTTVLRAADQAYRNIPPGGSTRSCLSLWPLCAPLCPLWLAFFCLPALAQGPEIAGLLPAGGQRGTTAVVQVDGKNLQGAKVLLSGRGVRVESTAPNAAGDGATVKLAIAPDAPLGPREIRIGTPKGVSNPARMWVDALPSIGEVEPNDDPAHAQRLDRTPMVVDGCIQSPTDRDTFSFQAGDGETWVFDVNAARIRSRLDPVIELRDEAGSLVKMAQSTWESDPRLLYTFAKGGRYLVTVRDTQFLGGPDFVYRLTVGRLPVVTGFLPRGEKPGRPVDLLLQGVNLGGTTKAVVTIPPDTPPGEFWTTVQTANGPALPFPLLVDSNPVAGITETDATMPLPLLPVSLDGAFEVYTRIRFFFKAT